MSRHFVLLALIAALTSVDAHAQYYYFGRRPVIARPVVPVPPPVLYGPTAIHSGPGSFSIQSPFFSFRVNSPPPPVYGYRTYSSFGVPTYRYPSVAPVDLMPLPSYSITVPTEPPVPATPLYPPSTGTYSQRTGPLYSAGAEGGIPDLTTEPRVLSARPAIGGNPMGQAPSRGLAESAQRLSNALSSRGEDGQVWLEYLQPDVIARAAEQGQLTPDVATLAERFEGVTMNPQLRSITRLPGFEGTRIYLSQAATSVPTQAPIPTEAAATPAEAASRAPATGTDPSSDLPSGIPSPQADAPTESIETLPEPIVDEDV
ncbi:MAG: hypothetical protein AAFX06_11035 [Planctomycetota bacterium]